MDRAIFCIFSIDAHKACNHIEMALRLLVSRTTNICKTRFVVANMSSQIYLQTRSASLFGEKKQKKPKIIYQTVGSEKVDVNYRSKLQENENFEYAWLKEANLAPKGIRNGTAFFTGDSLTTIRDNGKVISKLNNISRVWEKLTFKKNFIPGSSFVKATHIGPFHIGVFGYKNGILRHNSYFHIVDSSLSGFEKRMRPPLGLRDYEILTAKGNVFIIPDTSKGYPSKNPESPFCVLGYNWSENQWAYLKLQGDLPKKVPVTFSASMNNTETKMYFALGYQEEGTLLWELDLETYTMQQLPAPVNPRTTIGSTISYQAERIVKIGGYIKRSIGEHWNTDVEVYELASQRWYFPVLNKPGPKIAFHMARVLRSNVWVLGGELNRDDFREVYRLRRLDSYGVPLEFQKLDDAIEPKVPVEKDKDRKDADKTGDKKEKDQTKKEDEAEK